MNIIARPGHLIFCFGDCNNKNRILNKNELSTSSGSDNLMKQLWLEMYNRSNNNSK